MCWANALMMTVWWVATVMSLSVAHRYHHQFFLPSDHFQNRLLYNSFPILFFYDGNMQRLVEHHPGTSRTSYTTAWCVPRTVHG